MMHVSGRKSHNKKKKTEYFVQMSTHIHREGEEKKNA